MRMSINRSHFAHFTTRKTPHTCKGKERLSAAADALTQAPVVVFPLSYKQGPTAFSDLL